MQVAAALEGAKADVEARDMQMATLRDSLADADDAARAMGVRASDMEEQLRVKVRALPYLLLSKGFGTCKTVRARFWPGLKGNVQKTFYVVPSLLGRGYLAT